LDRKLGGPQSRSGLGGEEKNSQPLPGIEVQIPDRPANSLVTIPTELSRLLIITITIIIITAATTIIIIIIIIIIIR
jgi:hypothetical protein